MQRLYTVPRNQIEAVFWKSAGLQDAFSAVSEAEIGFTDEDGVKAIMLLRVERDGSARHSFLSGRILGELVHIHVRVAEFRSCSTQESPVIRPLEEVFPRLKLFAVHDTRLIEAVNDVKKKVADELATVKSEIAAIKDLMIEALAKYEWHRDVQRAIAENKLSLSE
jgi:hypothetical protein